MHMLGSYPHSTYLGFSPHEELFFSPILRVFTLMGFSPGLCRATTDLNQFLYVW